MVRLVENPTFSKKKELARWVSEADRLPKNLTADTAFIDPPADDPAKEFLSVNSLEVETVRQIADYYRQAFQDGVGEVAVYIRTVEEYTEAGKKSGVQVFYDRLSGSWQFIGQAGKPEAAYKLHRRTDRFKSPSHCGVEFVRMITAHQRAMFARRMAGHRYHKY